MSRTDSPLPKADCRPDTHIHKPTDMRLTQVLSTGIYGLRSPESPSAFCPDANAVRDCDRLSCGGVISACEERSLAAGDLQTPLMYKLFPVAFVQFLLGVVGHFFDHPQRGENFGLAFCAFFCSDSRFWTRGISLILSSCSIVISPIGPQSTLGGGSVAQMIFFPVVWSFRRIGRTSRRIGSEKSISFSIGQPSP